MTDMDMSQYLGAFLDEADDNLQRLDDLLLALEKDMVNMDVINEIFRAAHRKFFDFSGSLQQLWIFKVDYL